MKTLKNKTHLFRKQIRIAVDTSETVEDLKTVEGVELGTMTMNTKGQDHQLCKKSMMISEVQVETDQDQDQEITKNCDKLTNIYRKLSFAKFCKS